MRAHNSSKSRDKNYKLVNRYFGSSEAYIFRYIFDSAQRHAYMRYIKNAIASEKKNILSPTEYENRSCYFMSFREISKKLNLTEEATRSIYRRAIKKLRFILKDYMY